MVQLINDLRAAVFIQRFGERKTCHPQKMPKQNRCKQKNSQHNERCPYLIFFCPCHRVDMFSGGSYVLWLTIWPMKRSELWNWCRTLCPDANSRINLKHWMIFLCIVFLQTEKFIPFVLDKGAYAPQEAAAPGAVPGKGAPGVTPSRSDRPPCIAPVPHSKIPWSSMHPKAHQTFCLFSLGLSGGSDKRSWRGLLA